MDIKKEFGTDETKENAGVRHELDDKGAYVIVARTGNTGYSKLITSLYEKNQRTLKLKNEAANAKGEEILLEVLAKTVFLGCGGLEIDGVPVPDTVAGRTSLLKIKDFRAMISQKADDFEEYRLASVEEDAGNSQPA